MKVKEIQQTARELWHKSARADVSQAVSALILELNFIVRVSDNRLKEIPIEYRRSYICPYCGLYNEVGEYKACHDCGV